ncbi:hypothetical protein N7492_000791 [Penicillium capsulatum]|uniref:Uncharacterized protein n=1 Tax=Penicillium capsulatum TaxID=69766 RepID=A0A9W9LZB0_9EURO|nr:hypothetical protein N7492_000791 [Penicillium capsulatum]KAJ6130150.1 hypothetical protein N7512_002930 [Penicillium capsulatum]
MSADISPQVDIGSLSLSSLGHFSTLLTALSADDVQPTTLFQLEKVGVSLPINGPLAKKVPDCLQRYQSKRIERLGIVVGWRKGDSASFMAQSAGGQAIALLSTCLCNIYTSSGAGNVLHAISERVLPPSASTSSPRSLSRVASILADKLALVGFGSILAKQVCRIHDAYRSLEQNVPANILDDISEDWMAELIVKICRALAKKNRVVRIRGCYGVAYMLALGLALFPEDCLVTIEDIVIHRGARSSSVRIEVFASSGANPLEVQLMESIESMADIFFPRLCDDRPSTVPMHIHGDFAWHGLVSTLLHLELQQFGVVCTPKVVQAVGICALADATGPQLTNCHLAAIEVLGDNYRAITHQRCEIATGMSLPHDYLHLSFHDAFKKLQEVVRPLLDASPWHRFQAGDWNLFLRGTECALTNLFFDKIWLAWCMLFVHAHGKATWRPGDWGSDRPLSHTRGDVNPLSCSITSNKLFSTICPYWENSTLAISSKTNTFVPSPYLMWNQGRQDISQCRGLELLDGPIIYNDRYYNHLASGVHLAVETPAHSIPNSSGFILPTAEGIHSKLSMTIAEKTDRLLLYPTITVDEQNSDVCLANCLHALLALKKTHPCPHDRKEALNPEYTRTAMATSVRCPHPKNLGGKISIVQAANSPIAQILSLFQGYSDSPPDTPVFPSMLCYRCCLNCAYEQARSQAMAKIIVA